MPAPTYIHKHSGFTNTVTIPNATAQDHNLSWGARGLLAYLLSMPSDWQLNENHLIGCAPSGRDALRQLVRELEAHRYISRQQLRDGRGRVHHSVWEVWDRPQQHHGLPFLGSPHLTVTSGRSPSTASPSTEKPSTDKTLSLAEESPWTEIPSTVDDPPLTASPSTAAPSTEKPSHYKDNKETNSFPPSRGSSSLRSEEPLLAPPTQAPGGLARGGNASAAEQPTAEDTASRTQVLTPALEPYRPQLLAWWRARKARHPQASGAPLSARCIHALELALEAGQLDAYLTAAAEKGWLRLGDSLPARLARLGSAYSPDFEAWFATYRGIDRRATSLSKPAAWREYRALTTGPNAIAPDRLLDALGRAIKDQAAMEVRRGWSSPFPDAFRWLRDGRHEQYLDGSTPSTSAEPLHPAQHAAQRDPFAPAPLTPELRARLAAAQPFIPALSLKTTISSAQ